MNRLQVGGLALVIDALNKVNIGRTVTIVGFTDSGLVEVTANGLVSVTDEVVKVGNTLPEWLLPLGDNTGIELYKLQEELVEEQSQ